MSYNSEIEIKQLSQSNSELVAIENEFGYSSWNEEQIKVHFNRGSALVLLKKQKLLASLIYIQIDFEFEILYPDPLALAGVGTSFDDMYREYVPFS